MHRKHAIIAATAALLALPAAAQQMPQWYVGIGAGKSKTSDDIVDQRESTIVNGHSTGSTFDDSDGSWKIFAGWQVNPIFGLEAFYADLGKTHLVTNTLSVDNLAGTFDMTRKVDGFGLDMVVRGTVMPQFTVFGRLGGYAGHVKADATVSGGLIFTNDPSATSKSNSDTKTVAHYGFGGEWAFQPNAALRLEWERFDKMGKAFATGQSGSTGEASTDLATLSVLFRF
jgi:opacity protein-like surface antigen